MVTGIQANGTDLDSLLEPRTTTKIADVNIDSNGGVDISNRFEKLASGSAPSTTNIQKAGADLATLFAGIGTVVDPPLVSALANGDVNASIINSVWVGVKFDTDGEEYERNPNGGYGSTLGTWLDQGTSDQVWVEFIRTGGTVSKFDNRNNNQRYQANVDSGWYIVDTNANSSAENVIGYFRFWDASSGGNQLQQTSSATWSANRLADMCPTCCFTPWTLITMGDGSQMPIVDIRKGDLIRVENGIEPVRGIIVREFRVMYLIKFADGRQIEASEDHPFYVEGKGFAAVNADPRIDYKDLGVAKQLLVGDKVLDDLNKLNEIVSIDHIDYPEAVYTFENS